ncbi:DUF3987 domain-containing protein [Xanthobacter autotrophicus]|uniref:DUF3987 domain-containing protein n=1 Tax=Xanthobacter autotrophicus TaxID=280 RepID=UPI00372AA980
MDVEAAIEFLKTFDPTGVHHLCYFPVDGGAPTGRAFPPGAWEDVRRFLKDAPPGVNHYFSVNEPSVATSKAKCAKADIARIRAVFLDLDLDKNKPLAEAREDVAEKVEMLRCLDHPPVLVVHSGGGKHAYWLLQEKLPATDALAMAEGIGRSAAHAIGADLKTFNADRILALPGTIKFPDAKKREYGRGPEPVAVVHSSPRRCRLAELEAQFPPSIDAAVTKSSREDVDALVQSWQSLALESDANNVVEFDDLDRRFTLARLKDARLDALARHDAAGLLKPGDESGSAWHYALAARLVEHGFGADDFPRLCKHLKLPGDHPERYDPNEYGGAVRLARAWLDAQAKDLAFEARRNAANDPALWSATGTDGTKVPGAASGGANTTTWPEPLDIFDDRTTGGFRDLTAAALPNVIWRYAKDVAERMGVPIITVAAGALATFSIAAGSRVKLQPKRLDSGWTVPPFIWFLVVASPGSRKSDALKMPVGVLRAVQNHWNLEDVPKRQAWEAEKKRLRRPKAVGAQGDETPAPPSPRPKVRRCIADGFTVEALRDVLAENPNGVLVQADEIAGIIGSAGQYKNGKGSDRADFLKLIDGDPLTVDRVGAGTRMVPCWGASIVGSIQPGRIVEMAPGLEVDGLLQRFLPIVHDDTLRRPADCMPDAIAIAAYEGRVRRLAEMPATADDVVLKLSDEAHVIREQFDARLDALRSAPGAEALQGHVAKWGGMFARLLLIFHVASADDIGAPVAGATAERVWCFAEILLSHAYRFYENVLGVASPMALARRAAGAVLLAGNQATHIAARDIYRTCREWEPGRPDARQLNVAMQLLEDHGWCIRVDQKTRRDRPEWKINPKVPALFSDRAAAERARREEVRERIERASAERTAIRTGNAPATPAGASTKSLFE